MFILKTFNDCVELIGITALIGAVAGLVASLTRPPAGRKSGVFGIDNRIRFPRRYRNDDRARIRGVDLGSLGPMLIGAGGAIFVVFATGVDKTQIGTTAAPEIGNAIDHAKLIVLAITGGAAGELVFRTLASGEKVALGGAEEAIRQAATAASEAAADGKTPQEVAADAERAGSARLAKSRPDDDVAS